MKEYILYKLHDAIIMQEEKPDDEFWRGVIHALEDILEEMNDK